MNLKQNKNNFVFQNVNVNYIVKITILFVYVL